jgi:hypothetical protein
MASSADTPPKLLPLKELDPIVFANELIKQNLLPPEATDAGNDAVFKLRSRAGVLQPVTVSPTVPDGLKEGTFKGTQKALTAAYAGLLSSYATYFDIAGFEPSLPRGTTDLDVAKEMYDWSKPSAEDDYPPHLAQIPAKDAESLTKIFNTLRLLETGE